MRPVLRVLAASVGGLALHGAMAATPPPLVGVWKGQVGDAPVMACFDSTGAEYYYLRHLRGIELTRPKDEPAGSNAPPVEGYELLERTGLGYGEIPITGRWQLQAQDGEQLSGSWTSPDGIRTSPIRLTRVARAPSDSAQTGVRCDASFMSPIKAGVEVRKSPARFGAHVFTKTSTRDATALQVGSDVPNADRLNRFAATWLDDRAVLRYECDKGRENSGRGSDDPLMSSLEPVFWTSRFLVLRDSLPDVYCGGNHSNSSLSFITWSLQEGDVFDGWRWIEGGAGALIGSAGVDEEEDVRSPLFRELMKHHPRNQLDDSCRNALPHMGVDAPYPTAGGLMFFTNFAHATRACSDNVKLTWKQLKPYLSREGRQLAARPR